MAKHTYRQIEAIEVREKNGAYGAWRRDFCKNYRKRLVQARTNRYHALEKSLAETGETIACRKGCTYCCFHYIAVPLAHGIVIVDYLYERKNLLKTFLRNYEAWRHTGQAISQALDETRFQAFSSSMPINDIIAVTRPLSMRYLEMDIPCPFLEHDSCLIYAVRPLPCSGQYAVSPPDWCYHATAEEAVVHQLVLLDEDLLALLELAGPQLMIYEVTLPILVYRLLTEGASSMIQSCLQQGTDTNRGV